MYRIPEGVSTVRKPLPTSATSKSRFVATRLPLLRSSAPWASTACWLIAESICGDAEEDSARFNVVKNAFCSLNPVVLTLARLLASMFRASIWAFSPEYAV